MSTPTGDVKPTFPHSAHRQQLMAQAAFGEAMEKALREMDQRAGAILPAMASMHFQVGANIATASTQPLITYLINCYGNQGPTAQRLREEARVNDLIATHVDGTSYQAWLPKAEEAIATLSPHRFPTKKPQEIEALLAPYFPFLTTTGFNVFTPTTPICNDSSTHPTDMVHSTSLTPQSTREMAMGVWTTVSQPDNPAQRYMRWRLHIHQTQGGGSEVIVGLYGHSSANFGYTSVHLYNALEDDYFEIPVSTYTYGSSFLPRPPHSPLDYINFDLLKTELKNFMEHMGWSQKDYDAKCWTEEGLKEQIQALTCECPVYDFEPLRELYAPSQERPHGRWGFSKELPCPTQLTMNEYAQDAYASSMYMEWVDGGAHRYFRCKLPWGDRSGAIRVEGCFDTGEIRLLNADNCQLTLFPRARAGVFFKIKHLRKNYLLQGLRRWLTDEKHPVPDYLAIPSKQVTIDPPPEDKNKDFLFFRPKTDEELKAEWKLLPLSSLYVDPSEEAKWA